MAGSTIRPVEQDLGERPSSPTSGSGGYHSAEMHEMHDTSLLGPDGAGPGPAPSVFSRDSTFTSLAPSIKSGHGARSSWGSSKALAAGEGGMAGSTVSHPPPSDRGGAAYLLSGPLLFQLFTPLPCRLPRTHVSPTNTCLAAQWCRRTRTRSSRPVVAPARLHFPIRLGERWFVRASRFRPDRTRL